MISGYCYAFYDKTIIPGRRYILVSQKATWFFGIHMCCLYIHAAVVFFVLPDAQKTSGGNVEFRDLDFILFYFVAFDFLLHQFYQEDSAGALPVPTNNPR